MKASTPQKGTREMAPIQVDPQEFGEVKQMVREMHEIITTERCPLGVRNQITLKWVWASVCGLGAAFGAGFTYIFNLHSK